MRHSSHFRPFVTILTKQSDKNVPKKYQSAPLIKTKKTKGLKCTNSKGFKCPKEEIKFKTNFPSYLTWVAFQIQFQKYCLTIDLKTNPYGGKTPLHMHMK